LTDNIDSVNFFSSSALEEFLIFKIVKKIPSPREKEILAFSQEKGSELK